VSALNALTRSPLFRRLWLFAVGLLLAYGYWYDFIGDIIITPALIGVLVGMLSDRIVSAFINMLIILFGYVAAIVILAVAGNLGSGEPFVWDYYQWLIADTFIAGSVPLLTLMPALTIGQLIRYGFLLALKKTR
jgi:hypothetical protein